MACKKNKASADESPAVASSKSLRTTKPQLLGMIQFMETPTNFAIVEVVRSLTGPPTSSRAHKKVYGLRMMAEFVEKKRRNSTTANEPAIDGRATKTNARPTQAAAGMEPKKKKRKIAEELDDEHGNVHETMPDLEHTSSITSSPVLIQQSKKKHSYQEERMSLQKQDLEARTKSDSDRLLLDKEDGRR
ncbi:hypothetical protein DFJ73DRAFT_770300 [Zopfochytrium polystomum]|nr:hypothetical protein DFJ73DRAFT_770300 [Zopfochytrium polystomum]